MVSARAFRRMSVLALLLVVAFALVVATRVGGEQTTKAIDDLATLAAAASGAVAAGVAAVKRSSDQRRGWVAMAAGLAAWSCGELLWACYELGSRGSVPSVSWADVGYLSAVPLIVLGVALFPTAGSANSRARAVLDGSLLGSAVLLISWGTVLGPVFRGGTGSVLEQAVALAYPVGDIVIAATVLVVIAGRQRLASSPLALVAGGVLVMCVADSAYAYLSQTNAYATGNPIDGLWVAGYLILGLAALRPEVRPPTPPRRAESIGLGRLVLPYLVAGAAFCVVAVHEALAGSTGPFMFWNAVVLAVLVMARQFTTLLDNRWLNERLTEKVDELGGRERQLAHLAFHDPLTGLANRKLFQDRVERAVSARDGRPAPLAVLFIDLDDFKTINDSLGHEAGDALLVAVAERLRACVRPGDTAARLGGDEFAILIEDTRGAPATAGRMASRVLDAMRERFSIAGRDLNVSASVGVAATDHGQEAWEELLRHADVAMYAAKNQGKGCYAVFAASMATAAADRLDLKAAIDVALESGQFSVEYQPIVDLAGGGVIGAEALARWQHPERGAVPPGVFVPLAEESGRIHDLGRWVLNEACRAASAWQVGRRDVCGVSVNVSARQLHGSHLVGDVVNALGAAGLPPEALMLEITESVLMRDTERTLAQLSALRRLGVRLAIDDFGTGYSSLAYLPRFPVDVIKIDRTFVKDVCDEPTGSTLARTIVELAGRLSLQTIAEGVEDESQAVAMRAIGCTAGQGWWFGRPQPAPAMRRQIDAVTRLATPTGHR